MNKVFTQPKLVPPEADIVDAHGVMLFPGVASFSMTPMRISKLTHIEVISYLEAFGFPSVMGKIKRSSLKQLLMWKLVEEAFVLHHTTAPTPASYGRSTELTPAVSG